MKNTFQSSVGVRTLRGGGILQVNKQNICGREKRPTQISAQCLPHDCAAKGRRGKRRDVIAGDAGPKRKPGDGVLVTMETKQGRW